MEKLKGFRPPSPLLMKGIGQRRARAHPQEGIAVAVGEYDGLLRVPYGGGHLPQRKFQVAQVVGDKGSILPFAISAVDFERHLYQLDALGQPAEGAET